MNLAGKNVAVLGVADESSIAWGIARAFCEHGARVTIGQQQKYFSRVRLLLREFPAIRAANCDVTREAEVAAFFEMFRNDPLDVLVHSIAFGPPEIFTEYPSQVTAGAFAETLDVSAHSLARVIGHAKPWLNDWASVMTLSFQASVRALTLYGMMGVAKAALESLVRYLALELGRRRIRVNAISPGMVETLAGVGEVLAFLRNPDALARQKGRILAAAVEEVRAAEGSADELQLAQAAWRRIQQGVAALCPIEATVSREDVAGCALFLGSDYSRKITGQVIHVDCGLSSRSL